LELLLDRIDWLLEEEWLPVTEYEGLYEVSSFGNVKSLDRKILNNGVAINRRGVILKPHHKHYSILALCKNGKIKSKSVHRIVAIAFLSNPNNYEEVNHIDFNTKNNRLDNLEWVTPLQNSRHTVDSGRRKNIIFPNKYDDVKLLAAFTFVSTYSNPTVAKMFNISNSFINRISNGHKRIYLTHILNAIRNAKENNFAEYR
jgi:hypothetical protein